MNIAKQSDTRDGYQIYATDPVQGPVASYTEGETPGIACHRCFIQFPESEGYTEHSIKNLRTNAEYKCTKKKEKTYD